MSNDLRLKHQILLAYSLPLLLTVIMAALVWGNVITLENMDNDKAAIHEIYDLAKDLSYKAAKSQRALRGYLLNPNDVSLENFNNSLKDVEDQAGIMTTALKSEEGVKMLRKIAEHAKSLNSRGQYLISLVKEEKRTKALEEFSKGEDRKDALEMEKWMKEFEQYLKLHPLAEIEKKTHEAFVSIKKFLIVGSLLSVTAAALIGLWLASRISAPITKTIGEISATSNEISATLAQHERTAENQATMVAETSSTIEELGASSRVTAQQAETAAETARKAGSVTEEGKKVVMQAVAAMDGLKDKVGEIASQILTLAEQTSRINSIANLVKDLAGEINMLALNASVEAVRAGESGKGFAVVASEVRKLADQSKRSVEQAGLIVGDIQKATSSTIMITEAGAKEVEAARDHARKVDEFFDSIASSTGGVYDNAQQVLLNTRQQMAAVGQVVTAINSISAGAKETAAGIAQTRIGVQQLNTAAESLKRMT